MTENIHLACMLLACLWAVLTTPTINYAIMSIKCLVVWTTIARRGFKTAHSRLTSDAAAATDKMDVSGLRVPYSSMPFLEQDLVSSSNPLLQFQNWFQTALDSPKEEQPNAACLSTSTPQGHPSSRMLLVKKFDEAGFTFFTNHNSRKGRELATNPNACLLFFWASLHRQVRIEGTVATITDAESDAYFHSRPLASQLSATVSPQSSVVPSRKHLQDAVEELERRVEGGELTRPPHWGGFLLNPVRYEFWQGQTDRLHDRVVFSKQDGGGSWSVERLAP